MPLQIHQFSFCGLARFPAIRKRLSKLLDDAFHYHDYSFFQAIEEAVENAARYSTEGFEKAPILIKVRLMPTDAAVSIYSSTQPFDALAYQKKLRRLAADPKASQQEWGDYLGMSTASSGFFYMLTGCDYLYLDRNGQNITLVKRIKNKEETEITKIGLLVPRFLVKHNGVIG